MALKLCTAFKNNATGVLKYNTGMNEKFKYVTGPDKTGLIALFCILKNTDFNTECTVLLWWLDTVMPDILYHKCSYITIIS